MEMKSIGIDQIQIAKYNPRRDIKKGDEEYGKIERSIEHYGLVDPLIINKDGILIAGHQRYKVIKDLGFSEVDCIVLDMDKKSEKLLNIALNKISGEWDISLLKDLLQELDTGDFDIENTGFSLKEFEDLVCIPGFSPVDEEDQPRLDELKKVCCPACEYKFTLSVV